MSLPKHTASPSLSSSPSRQSIRRTDSNAPSRPQSIIDRPPTAQQTTHDPTDLSSQPQVHPHQDGHHEYPPAAHPYQQQQQPFQPFFTLIEDANTNEYYHPTVHYIFSDDDADIVTEATLRSLEADVDGANSNPKSKPKPAHDQPDPTRTEDYPDEDDDFASPRKHPLLPPPIPGVRDNYIILDVETASAGEASHAHPSLGSASTRENINSASLGVPSQIHPPNTQPQNQPQQQQPQFTIPSSHSLSPTWQVLRSDLLPAPTFETNTSTSPPSSSGLMLKIQGTAGLPMTLLPRDRDRDRERDRDRDKERSSQRLEEMMEQFSKRLGELRLVIEAGEKGGFGERGESREGREDTNATALGAEYDGNALGVDLRGHGDGAENMNTEHRPENEGQEM